MLEPKAKPMGVSAVFSRRENSSREAPLTIMDTPLLCSVQSQGQGEQDNTVSSRVRNKQEAAGNQDGLDCTQGN